MNTDTRTVEHIVMLIHVEEGCVGKGAEKNRHICTQQKANERRTQNTQ